MSKLITVFGATGTQGGSVIRELLKHLQLSREFHIRGITRDVAQPAARALAQQGVDVQSADMSSKPSLLEALKGSHSVFLVTTPNFQNPEAEDELVQGKNVADVAKQIGVQHLLFSSLVNVTEASSGRLKHVLHFDRKAEVERYIRDIGIPSTFVLPGYFMTNYTALGMIQKGENDTYNLAYPVSSNAKFPLIDAGADVGKFVVAAILGYPQTLGAQILAASGYYTPGQIVDDFTKATGKQARFVQIDADTYKNFLPPPMAQEMLENHLLIDEPGYYGGKSSTESLALLEKTGLKPTSWKEFLEKNKNAFL